MRLPDFGLWSRVDLGFLNVNVEIADVILLLPSGLVLWVFKAVKHVWCYGLRGMVFFLKGLSGCFHG